MKNSLLDSEFFYACNFQNIIKKKFRPFDIKDVIKKLLFSSYFNNNKL
ncbi:hypothetical protein C8C85_0046 [Flavobacterium sp. 103]|nr:hypothetical protein C8C85_0046 [Flavobacterium sp. 103]